MSRRLIKKFFPNQTAIRDHKHLRILGPLLQDPNLLHLNRRSVSGGIFVGLFLAFVPVPFQMLLAAAAALVIRVNLPIAVATVWISNPITMAPLFYFSYRVGAWVLDLPSIEIEFELSFEWLKESLVLIWQPFLLGCFIVGATSSIIGGYSVRLLWRWHVIQSWNERKSRRTKK